MSQVDVAKELGSTQATISSVLKHADVVKRDRRSSQYRDGRSRNGDYVVVMLQRDDPMWSMAYSTGYVLEHRLLVARAIGRPLLSEEDVHHRDGQKIRNTVGPCFAARECKCAGDPRHNLELWSTSQPRGQRVADKVAYAREILALYGHLV